MASNKKPLFDAKEIAKQWLELKSKQWVFIRNNWIKQAIMSNHYVKNDFE